MAANFDPNTYLNPALNAMRGRGGRALGGTTWLGAAPMPGAVAPAGGTRLGGLAQGQRLRQPGVVTMTTGNYRMGPSAGPIVARPSARNSAEYYAQRDAVAGNPLDNLELGNRDRVRMALRARYGGAEEGAGVRQADVVGETRFNPSTGQWEGVSASGSQPAPSSFAYGIDASASPGPVSATGTAGGALTPFDDEAEMAALMADADRQFRIDRIMGAKNRARMMGGVADITDSGDVEKTIGGIPANLYWQREANRGMSSNVAPMPGFGLGKGGRAAVPYQPTFQGDSYLNRLSDLYKRRAGK